MPIVGALLFPAAPLVGVAAYKMERRRRLNKTLRNSAQSFAGGSPSDQTGVRFGTWDARSRQFQVAPEFRNVFGGNTEPTGPVDMLTPDEAHFLRKRQMQNLALPPRFRGGNGGTYAAPTYAAATTCAPAPCGYDAAYTGCGYGSQYASPACTSPVYSSSYASPCSPTSGYAPSPLAPVSSANAYINTQATPSPIGAPVVHRAGAAFNEADIYSH